MARLSINEALDCGAVSFSVMPAKLSSRKRGAGIHSLIKVTDFTASDGKLPHYQRFTLCHEGRPPALMLTGNLSHAGEHDSYVSLSMEVAQSLIAGALARIFMTVRREQPPNGLS